MGIEESASKRDFPGGPVVKNLPCNAGDAILISYRGTKIPDATEQLSPSTTATVTVSGEKLKAFPQGQDKDVHSRHFLNTVLEVLATAIREGK